MNGTNYSKYDFSGRLKDRRIACGITSCEKLAGQLFPGKNIESMRKRVEKWEKGLTEPTVSEFYGLCKILDCDPEYLWGTINEPRRDTRTVMEITNLEQDAVETLVSFTNAATKSSAQFLNPGYIISLVLKNPGFYGSIREIIGTINNQMILEKTKIERSLVKPGQEAEYEAGVAELKTITDRIGSYINEYGYTVVEISELLKMMEFRTNQNLSAVIHETVDSLHDEAISFIYGLLEDAKQKCGGEE